MNYHVIPLNDWFDHDEIEECHCKPKIEIEGEDKLIIHNAYDGREEIELAKAAYMGYLQ